MGHELRHEREAERPIDEQHQGQQRHPARQCDRQLAAPVQEDRGNHKSGDHRQQGRAALQEDNRPGTEEEGEGRH
jgi:hypothetical protein